MNKIFTVVWDGEKEINYIGNIPLQEVIALVQQIMIKEIKEQAVEEYKKEQTNVDNL